MSPLRLLALALALFALASCRGPEPRGTGRVTVYAASSLTGSFDELATLFEARHPGSTVLLEYGASSQLRAQIEQGAPADVFAAADHAPLKPLVDAGRAGDPRAFARNLLVIVVPRSNPAGIRTPHDLAKPGLRVVSAAETVPIGRYTQQMLSKLGRLSGYPEDFAEQVRVNIVSREPNVRAILAKVELGEADAAIVYATDARSSDKVMVIEVPEQANVTAEYPIATLSGSENAALARQFVELVFSDAGQQILRKHGFR